MRAMFELLTLLLRALCSLTPEEFAAPADNLRSSAIARTARPAQELLAAAVQRAPASDSKPDSFSATLRAQRRMAGKTAIGKCGTAGPIKMHQNPDTTNLRARYQKG